MATKNITNDREQLINELMAQLRSPTANNSVSLRQRVEDAAVDALADSTAVAARLGAAAVSSLDVAKDAYALERERQLRRRAERILIASGK